MKVLPDECMPTRLRHALPGHDVRTVAYMGWDSIRNGELLALAATDIEGRALVGFDAQRPGE